MNIIIKKIHIIIKEYEENLKLFIFSNKLHLKMKRWELSVNKNKIKKMHLQRNYYLAFPSMLDFNFSAIFYLIYNYFNYLFYYQIY
jgi:hypothetical protein